MTTELPQKIKPLSSLKPPSEAALSLAGAPFYIAPCDVGLGVFASRDIRAGEPILCLTGRIIDFAETKRRGPRECMAIQIGFDRYIDTQAPGVYVNHSCEPNAGIRDDHQLVALTSIGKGAEIRFDYSTTMQEQSFTMQCLCGAPACRGFVRDFSTLPRKTRDRYMRMGVAMSFILQLMEEKREQSSLLTAFPAAARCVCP